MTLDRDALRARLRALFLDELEEHVVILNRGLLALEQGASGDEAASLVNELFRSAHSLKGAAQAAAVEPVAAVCHELESTLAVLRDNGGSADDVSLEALFDAVDALATAARQLREGGDASDLPVARLVRALSTVVAPEGTGGEGPTSTDHHPAAASTRQRPPAAPPAASPSPPGSTGPRASPAVPPTGQDEASPERPTQAAVRVPADRLDALLGRAGEVLLACEGMHAVAAQAASPEAAASGRVLASAQRALTEAVRQAGMVPFSEACAGLDRVLRDVAKGEGKQARLVMQGVEVELDRPIIEALREPLLHLVRNAVDHGIEAPEARVAAAKQAAGTVTVAASPEGARVAVTVSDDGRGVDAGAVRAAAVRRGIAGAGEPHVDVLRDLVFAPGVSTAPLLTDISGRGVGLDAVRDSVEGLGGSVTVESTPGAGTKVTLLVPVTRSVIRVILATGGGETFAVPTSAVVSIVRARAEDLETTGGPSMLRMDDRLLPVAWLADLVAGGEGARTPSVNGLLVEAAGGEAVLAVDELLAEQEAVVKPPPARLAGLPGVLGATILPSGRTVLVLNAATSVRLAMERPRTQAPPPAEGPARAPRVLLVDDTLTTRTLERSILETAGYEVLVAVDGLHALELLQAQAESGVDAVVSDVNMPRMDGLSLCAAVRASSRFDRLPVVLVTSLASEEDRQRGVEAGANAYIAKSEFDQSMLLDTLARLL